MRDRAAFPPACCRIPGPAFRQTGSWNRPALGAEWERFSGAGRGMDPVRNADEVLCFRVENPVIPAIFQPPDRKPAALPEEKQKGGPASACQTAEYPGQLIAGRDGGPSRLLAAVRGWGDIPVGLSWAAELQIENVLFSGIIFLSGTQAWQGGRRMGMEEDRPAAGAPQRLRSGPCGAPCSGILPVCSRPISCCTRKIGPVPPSAVSGWIRCQRQAPHPGGSPVPLECQHGSPDAPVSA